MNFPATISTLLIVCTILTTACTPTTPSTPQPAAAIQLTRIRFGYIPIVDAVLYYVADKKGFFREENLEIEGSKLAGGAAISAAIEGGSLDVGLAGTVPVIQAHLQGFNFKYFAPLNFEESPSHLTFHLLAKIDSNIYSPKDLEDKRVASNALGGVNELMIRSIMDTVGADHNKARLIAIPFEQMEVALQQGRVDAVSIVEPFGTQILERGLGRVIERGSLGSILKPGERIMIAGVIGKKDWLESNLELVRRFARALGRSTEYALQNEGEARQIIAEYTGVPLAVAERMIMPALYKEIRRSDLQPVINAAAKIGMIDRTFDASELIFEPR
jgi:NitT/TauT family transport system substrate-binding protein